jgi:hypothetical protein
VQVHMYRAPAAAPVISGAALTGGTAITNKPVGDKKGPKTKLLSLVPRKGSITLDALAEKAEGEGIKAARVPKFVAALAKYGYVELA